MPNLVAYDLAGVQPMTGPTGLIFAMRFTIFENMTGPEALFNEADTAFSAVSSSAVGDVGNPYVSGSDGVNVGFGTTGGSSQSSDPSALNPNRCNSVSI